MTESIHEVTLNHRNTDEAVRTITVEKVENNARKSMPRKLNAKELLNYKGNFNDNEKAGEGRYTCPETGAHFEYNSVCSRLEVVAVER